LLPDSGRAILLSMPRPCRPSRLLLVACALACTLAAPAAAHADPTAARGEIRLGDEDLRRGVKLAGAWQFVWGRLVPPAELAAAPAGAYLDVPGFWSASTAGYPAEGSATYRLIIDLPDQPAEPLGVILTQISTAYRVYGNGIPLAENGTVSTRSEEVRGVLAPRTVFISAAGRLDLVIQVSNADDVTAGINEAPVIGYQSVIAPRPVRSTLFEGLIYASILVMALYHLLLAILHPAEKASLFFGLLSLDLGLRGLLTGTRIIHQLFGGIGFHTLIAAEYITVYLAGLLVYLYFYELFPKERPEFARIPLLALTGALVLFVAVAPISLITPVHFYYEILLLALGLLIVVWIVRALVARRDGAGLMLAGFLVLLGGAAYDIVQNMLHLSQVFVSSYAMFFFIFLQAALIARRYAAAFHSVEEQSLRAAGLATSYGRFVPREFLSLLGKESIVNVDLGDQIETDMTVLFSDIRSFTSLSENMSPRENFNFLNSYLKRISPVIRSNRGFIDKYLGDGIMALFPRSAADALRASAEMMSVLREYNGHRANSGYRPIAIGVGINTGKLMLGTVGEESRMEGTVISDVVNLASRLEGLTATFGTPVLVSSDVVAACADGAGQRYRYLGRARVKGKARAIAVYEVVDGGDAGKERSRVAFERAVRAFEARRFAEARRAFEQIVAADPTDGPARYYLNRFGERPTRPSAGAR
jgi:adenylate cyclase